MKVRFNTEANWNSDRDLIGEKGAVYIYTDHLEIDGAFVPVAKYGDGKTPLIDLPFAGVDIDELYAKIAEEQKKNQFETKKKTYEITDSTLVIRKKGV